MAAARRPPSKWLAPMLFAFVALLGVKVVHDFLASAPPLESLTPITVTLTRAPEEIHPGQRTFHGPYAQLTWQGGKAQIEHLCFLSNCRMPREIAALRAGDRVNVWAASGTIWKLEGAHGVLLHYDDMRDAFAAGMKRRNLVAVPLFVSTLALLLFVAFARRNRKPADVPVGNIAPGRTRVRVTYRVSVNGKKIEEKATDETR